MLIDIKEVRKALATAVGTAQGTIGVLAVIGACILYSNLFGFQRRLDVATRFVPLYTLVLIVFGLFSIISGLFLLTEIKESS